jgi:hypothetical protein
MILSFMFTTKRVVWLLVRWLHRSIKKVEKISTKEQKNSRSCELDIGIAEGGARTHDLEVDLLLS